MLFVRKIMIFHRTILTAQRDNKFANRISSGHVASEKQSSEERCSTFVHTHTHTHHAHHLSLSIVRELRTHIVSPTDVIEKNLCCVHVIRYHQPRRTYFAIYLFTDVIHTYKIWKVQKEKQAADQRASSSSNNNTTQHTAKTFLNISHAYNVYRKRWRNYFVIYHPFVLYKGLLRDQRDRINIIIFLSIYLSRSRKIDSRIEEQIKKNTHILRARTTF